MPGRNDRRSGHGAKRPVRPYPRSARVNALLVEVLATELERLSDADDRLTMLTITAVQTDPEIRRALVLFSSLSDAALVALEEHRVALQAVVGRGGRMKRTPLLSFAPDPAVAAGERVEEAIRRLHDPDA